MTFGGKITGVFLLSLMFGCGGGDDTKKVGSPQVAAGAYQLTSTLADVGCSSEFAAFLVANAGALQPGNSILDITPVGENSINATLRGTALALILTASDSSKSSYTGSLTGTRTISDCVITESLNVTIIDNGKTISVDVRDAWANTPVSLSCLFLEGTCANRFSYLGNPL